MGDRGRWVVVRQVVTDQGSDMSWHARMVDLCTSLNVAWFVSFSASNQPSHQSALQILAKKSLQGLLQIEVSSYLWTYSVIN